MRIFSRWFGRAEPKQPVSGITIFILQKRIERFTSEQLSAAMQRAWGRPYDKTNFYGTSIADGDGGVLKMDAMFFTLEHFDRRADASLFAHIEVPKWAEHGAYTSFGYQCPGGVPAGPIRDQMGWLLGRFCAELLGNNTVALFFAEAEVLVPFTDSFDRRLRESPGENPEQLFANSFSKTRDV